MKPVDFHPDASQEANDAVDYYDELKAGLGDDFRIELHSALARLRHNPQMYAVETGAIRICPLHRFPYSIYYEETAARIWVAAVAHHRRRPGYWAGRKPT